MKRKPEQLIEEISDFLVVYLKSGKIGFNSFVGKTDLNIAQLERLLNLHFLLKQEVKEFVRDLPALIRRMKTSTILKQETSHGKVRGEIQWQETLKERFRRNLRDLSIFSYSGRQREFAIKENLVLWETVRVLYEILFEKIDSEACGRYEWFREWNTLKDIVNYMVHKNVYLSRVKQKSGIVTDRMIMDTMKHRSPLYRRAAEILSLYRQIMTGKLSDREVRELLAETFIFPQNTEVLFELYWVVKIIQANAADAELQILDGKNPHNLAAQWTDGTYVYKIYHDSAGSERIKFYLSSEEVAAVEHPFVRRKLQAMNAAEKSAREWFGFGFDAKTFWSGRPDIIVEIVDGRSDKLKKVVIGEVKYTERVDYAITGLRELMDYMKLVRDDSGRFLEDFPDVAVEGMLFTDAVPAAGRLSGDFTARKSPGNLVIEPEGTGEKVRWVSV